jgi:ATP-dependent DNA ligase
MNFKTLYARTNTGAVQQWTVTVGENFYTTTYGQKDGQLVTTEPSFCAGKNIGKANKTSPQSQAIKEAQALYKKKLKEGYKENIDEIDNEGFFEPQLAKQFEDYKDKVTYPLAAEDKLNGIRCIFSKKGAFSRKGEEFHCLDHLKEELAPLFEKHPDLILDGELFNPVLKNELNKIASLVSVNRKITDVTDEDRARAKEIIQYHVYDGFNLDLIQTHGLRTNHASPFSVRKYALKLVIDNLNSVKVHDFTIVFSEQEIKELMEKVRAEKREGIMLKVLDAPYENKRSKNTLKLKIFYDDEFEVVGFEEGTGNWKGKVKKVICKLKKPATNGKTTFESNIRGSMETLADLWENREQHLGKLVTVEYQELSPYGVPLIPYCEPMFRDYE